MNRLIAHACERLRQLTRRMLRGYPVLLRWIQTDDVLQNALIRLCGALEAIRPESARHFYKLAALQIRRELIDLSRKCRRSHVYGEAHITEGANEAESTKDGVLDQQASATDDPATLEAWTRFHESVGALPDEEREVFGLLWYDELTQEQAAQILNISIRTVKRRWQSARLKLATTLKSGEGS